MAKALVKLNTTIENLLKQRLLSGRTYNCLLNRGIFTVDDIIGYIQKYKDLSQIYNLDRNGELQIKFVLLQCQFQTGVYKALELGVKALDYYDLLDNYSKSCLSEILENEIKNQQNTEEPFPIKLKFEDIRSFFSTIDNQKDEILKVQQSLTKDQNIDFRQRYIHLIEEMIRFLHEENRKNDPNPILIAFALLLNDFKKEFLEAPANLSETDITNDHLDTLNPSQSHREEFSLISSGEAHNSRSKSNSGTSKKKDINSIGYGNMSKDKENERISIPVRKLSLFASEITHSAYDAKEIDDILQKRYDLLCDATLRPRAMHFKQKYLPSYKDVMPYLDKTLEEYSRMCPGRIMSKTLREIHQIVQFFRSEVVDVYENFNRGWEFEDFEESIEEFDNFYNKDFKELKADFDRGKLNYHNYDNLYSIEQFHDYINKKLYPYLDKSEYDFVKSFTEQHGFRPIFYLAYKALPHSHASGCIAFSMRYGLENRYLSYRLPLEEVARRLRLTKEEALDLINRHEDILKDLMIFPYEKENYPNIIDSSNLITEDSTEASAIIAQERLPKDFWIFSALFSLFFDYRIPEGIGYRLLISPILEPHLIRSGALSSLINDFEKRYKKGVTEDVFIPLSHFNSYIPKEFNKELVELLSLLAKDKDAVTIKEDGVLFSVNINEEVFKILRKEGKLMSIEAIFERFKQAYPSHEFSKPTQLAEYLRRSDRIKKIGHHNLYGLPGWTNKVFYGNIRDLLFSTLKKSKTPMLPKELYEVVRTHFPSTNANSIRTSMQNDTQGRFVQFEGGYFGLSNKKYSSEFVKAVSKNAPVTKPLEECTFDEMIIRIEAFIQKNQRLPLRSGDEEEVALRCCLVNEKPQKRKLSPQESERLKAIIKHYSDLGYPRTLAELKFLQKCSEYKRFVKEHKALPGGPSSWVLADWFYRTLSEYSSHYRWFEDKRVDFLLDLVEFLESQGYEVDLPEEKRRH